MSDSLLSRLEALTAPSREIDAEIALANGWAEPNWGVKHRMIYWRAPDRGMYSDPPRYTESLDAALTLVPGEWAWTVFKNTDGDGGDFRAWASRTQGDSNANPAIALLIAIRKAKEESKSLRAAGIDLEEKT